MTVLVASLTLITACASIPTSGPVTEVPEDVGLGESTVHYTPTGPSPGASPQRIVHGFLDAMLAYPVSHTVATSFLTEEAIEKWRPLSETTVYVDATTGSASMAQSESAGHQVVPVSFRRTAVLDSQGHITAVDESVTQEWQLRLVDGEWRISEPPNGAMITRAYFEAYYRSFDLHFLNSSRTGLIQDPVYAAVGDQLATTLVSALMAGTENVVAADVSTTMPPRETLHSAVPIESGLADIEFDTDPTELSDGQQEQIVAQLIWTLAAVPGVDSVRVRAQGSVLAPGGEVEHELADWRSFGPRRVRDSVSVVADGVVVAVDEGGPQAVAGPWGEGVGEATSVVVGRNVVAATTAEGLLLTELDGSEVDSLAVSNLTEPSIDHEDRVWVGHSGSPSRLFVGELANGFAEVDAGPLRNRVVESFVVSPDGGRFAAAVRNEQGSSLLIGAVRQSDGEPISVGATREVPLEIQAFSQLQWLDGTRLVMLTEDSGRPRILTVGINGSEFPISMPGVSARLGDVLPTEMATIAGPDPRLFLLDGSGVIWTVEGLGWEPLELQGATSLS